MENMLLIKAKLNLLKLLERETDSSPYDVAIKLLLENDPKCSQQIIDDIEAEFEELSKAFDKYETKRKIKYHKSKGDNKTTDDVIDAIADDEFKHGVPNFLKD